MNDFLDTGRDDWRLCAVFAAMRHEMYNADTAKRIRRTLRNRFMTGGVVQTPIYGYIKPHQHANDSELCKDPVAEPIYDEWFRMLEGVAQRNGTPDNGATFAEVADWLNAKRVPTGPDCDRDEWDGRMVGRITRNPILKGIRVRNDRIAKRVNKTGRRKSIKAPPEERLERNCPHLAFIEPERYDRVIRLLQQRNAKYRRRGENGRDTRANVSRKRTRWPGQHIFCGICGRLYVFGGHGQKDHLMCTGAREYKCWNGMTVDGPLAVQNLSKRVFDEIASTADFDAVFVEMAQVEARAMDKCRESELYGNQLNLDRVTHEIANMVKFIRGGRLQRYCPSRLGPVGR